MADVNIEASENINWIQMVEQGSTPATPAAGFWRVYPKADGLYVVNDSGDVTGPFGTLSEVNFNVNGSLVGSGGIFDFVAGGGISLVGSQASPTDPMVLTIVQGGGVRAVSGTGAIVVTDSKILADTTSAGFTLTLPPPGDCAVGQAFTIKKISSDGNTLTLAPNVSETIDGAGSKTITAQWGTLVVFTDGTDWFVQ